MTLKKESPKIVAGNDVEKMKILFRFLFGSMLIFTSFMFVISFLYYPNISPDITYDKYLLIALATVAISTFILNSQKGKSSEAYYFRKYILILTKLTVFFLIIGTFMSFMLSNRIPIANENILDKASLNCTQMGLMGGGLLGMANIMFLFMERKPNPPVRKKSAKLNEENKQ